MNDVFGDTIRKIRDNATGSLSNMVEEALGNTSPTLQQQQGTADDITRLLEARSEVAQQFAANVSMRFDNLLGYDTEDESLSLDFNNLSLVDEDVQEAYIALEGMAAHARNCDINDYLRFTVLVNSRFQDVQLDESNNPLDPGQLAEAFKQAVRPLDLSADALLAVYREFNLHVFHKMEKVLRQANDTLVSTGISPNLEVLGRTRKAVSHRRGKPRERVTSTARAFRTSDEGSEQYGTSSPGMHHLLVDLLHKYQDSGFSLQTAAIDDQNVLDRESADTANLVSLLFAAIQDDVALPEAPRTLIGKAQNPIFQIALSDPAFFEDGDHPARQLLNELAAAGIGWTRGDQLEDDLLYRKARDAVSALVNHYRGDQALVDALLKDFLEFKERHVEAKLDPVGATPTADVIEQRKEGIASYAQRKITERITDPGTPSLIRQLLEGPYRKFLTEVILRDGPGSDSWKPVMDTIDVLLWSVARGKTESDRARLEKINPRLLSNLGRALKIAGINAPERDRLLAQAQQLQQESFSPASNNVEAGVEDEVSGHSAVPGLRGSETMAPMNQEQLEEVRKLAIGMWFEFDVDESHKIRCTLASKIPGIGRYIFVNRQGIKVLDQSEAELARDLSARSARLINNGRLIDRAIETVIANFRSAIEQTMQTAHVAS
jgi:hypothetical protein